MNSNIEIRSRSFTQSARPRPGQTISDMEKWGNFQRVLLHAFELRQLYREVFLLRDIQGHTLSEVASILGVSRDTAAARLKQARRELQRFASVDAAKGPK
jgi:RNA polymerase sigma factor (sigma-70 family)